MSGSASDLRAAINNIANWNTANTITSSVAFVTTGFSVTGSGGAAGDPHIKFANGGTADFRGSHRHLRLRLFARLPIRAALPGD